MRIRIAVAAVPAVLLVWLGIAVYLVQRYNAEINGMQQASGNLAQAFEENIRRSIETIDTTIRAVRVARAADPAHFDLVAWARDSGLIREQMLLSLADRNGDILMTTLGNMAGKRASIADREPFRVPRETAGDSLFISRPVIGRFSGQWSVLFARKLFDADGAFDGVIVASIDPAFLSRFYASLDIGRGVLLLLGEDGIVRSAGPETAARLGDDLSGTPLMGATPVDARDTVRMSATADGIERTYSRRRLDPYGLVVVVGLSSDDALAGYLADLKGCIAIGLGLTVMIVLVSAILAHNRRDIMRSREMLRAALENISQGLMVIDTNRRVPLLNARAAELLDLPAQLTIPGCEFDSILEWQLEAGEFAGEDSTEVRTLVESGGIERDHSVYRRTRRNGTVLEVSTKVLDTGLAVRTFTDITDQQRTARILADARDSAEAAARDRSEFLAVMSHEIRTPLNGVIGVAGLLEDMELGPTQRDYVRLIRQSGDHLLGLLNDILDFSRLEAQRVELEAVDFDPRALIHDVAGMFLTQAATKGLHLSAVAGDSVPATVRGDPSRLRQILLNLVGNAVKFTDEGWIRLTLSHRSAADNRLRLLFGVADSGIGIVPDAVERMFQEFTQADGTISRRFGGSGLGLAICRRLVELMGGSIAVESQPGKGSTFRFDVTLDTGEAAVPPAPAADAAAAAEPGLRVLLAEDNPTNRLVAVRLLERLGHQADAVGNGVEAIAALALAHYDLILMDVMMPDMDGLTATRRIRAAQSGGTRIAIVGLTAGSGAENLAACLDAGMDAVTTKPVTLARLRSAIAEGLSVGDPGPATMGEEALTPRLRELTETLGLDAVAEITRTFAEDSQANMNAMELAAARNDSETIYRSAHSVAGAARNVGADALGKRASTLEETVGLLSATEIAAEIAAIQADLDAVLDRLGIRAEIPAIG